MQNLDQQGQLKLIIKAPTDKQEALWQQFSTDTKNSFYQKMTKGLPAGTDLHLRLDAKGQLNSITYKYEADADSFHFIRTFDHHTKTVFHRGGACQGKSKEAGVNKIVQCHMFDLYEAHGFKTAGIFTEDIGCYAWARLGFKPTDHGWGQVRRYLQNRLDYLEAHPWPEQGPLPARYIDTMRQVLGQKDPKNLWFIADQDFVYYGQKMGKLMLLEWHADFPAHNFPPVPNTWVDGYPLKRALEWSGRLELQDPDCRARLESYLAETRRALKALDPAPAKDNTGRKMTHAQRSI